MKPALSSTKQLYRFSAQPHLLLEFAVHRLLGTFITMHTTLRELPGIAAVYAAPPQNLIAIIANDDPHIRAEALAVDDTFVVWCWLQVRFRVVVTMARHCGANRQSVFFHTSSFDGTWGDIFLRQVIGPPYGTGDI